MMRIVVVDDIYATEDDIFVAHHDEHAVKHGGYDDWWKFKCIAEEQGYSVIRYVKDFSFKENDIIYFCDRQLLHFYKGWRLLRKEGVLERSIAVLIESDVVDRKCGINILKKIQNCFPYFLTYQDALIDNTKFFKIWPYINIDHTDRISTLDFKDRGLACLVATNQVFSETYGELYTERKRIVEWFEKEDAYKDTFKVYGRNWEKYTVYGGIPENKDIVYSKYKFAFCLENCRRDGYITEKIFDCFCSGVVPIYMGAPNVNKYLPVDTYIDYATFSNISELVDAMEGMNEDVYRKYLENASKALVHAENRFGIGVQFASIKRIQEMIEKGQGGCIKTSHRAWFALFIYVHLHEIKCKIKNRLYETVSKMKGKFFHTQSSHN